MVGRLPGFENPSVIKAEFTTKLRLIVINPMSEKVLLAQLQKGSFNSRKCEVSPALAYDFAKIWR
jgi:hypothetical protein